MIKKMPAKIRLGVVSGLLIMTFAASVLEARQVPCRVETLDGGNLAVQLAEIRNDETMVGQGLPDGFRLSQALALDFQRPVVVKASGGTELVLVNGGRIRTAGSQIENESVIFDSTAVRSPLPLEVVRALIWKNDPRVQSTLASPLPDNDQVVVATDDGTTVVTGLLEGISEDKVQINYQDKSRTIGRDKVLAVVLAKLNADSAAGQSALARAQLTDGSTIVGLLLRFTPTECEIGISTSTSIKVLPYSISRIEIQSNRLAYLSDMTPLEVEQRTLFGAARDWRPDTNIAGESLSLRELVSKQTVEFRKGFGTKAFTRLAFANAGEFNRLMGTVGLDPGLGGQGDCEVAVRGDGIELWKTRLHSESPTQSIDLDISGIGKVELVVHPGQQFDLGDFVNWCNPRFLRTK